MTARIASIHFAPVHADRSIYGGHYDIPAQPLNGKPFILEVREARQIEYGEYGQNRTRKQNRYLIDPYIIAYDIVGEWTQNGRFMSPECHPGIWVVRDRVPELLESGAPQLDADNHPVWREATPAETAEFWEEDLQAARLADQIYAKALFQEGNAMANDHRGSLAAFIQKPAKLGAQQYGYQADWTSDVPVEPKTCQFCTKKIPKKSIVCPFCREIVDATAYGIEQAKRDRETKRAIAEAKLAA